MNITSKCVLKTIEIMETAATQVNNLTLAWVKAHVNIEVAYMAAKERATGGMHIKKSK